MKDAKFQELTHLLGSLPEATRGEVIREVVEVLTDCVTWEQAHPGEEVPPEMWQSYYNRLEAIV